MSNIDPIIYESTKEDDDFYKKLIDAVRPINGYVFPLEFGKLLLTLLSEKDPELLNPVELNSLINNHYKSLAKYFTFKKITDHVLVIVPFIFPGNSSVSIMTIPRCLTLPNNDTESIQVIWFDIRNTNYCTRTLSINYIQTSVMNILARILKRDISESLTLNNDMFVFHEMVFMYYNKKRAETYQWILENVKEITFRYFHNGPTNLKECVFPMFLYSNEELSSALQKEVKISGC